MKTIKTFLCAALACAFYCVAPEARAANIPVTDVTAHTDATTAVLMRVGDQMVLPIVSAPAYYQSHNSYFVSVAGNVATAVNPGILGVNCYDEGGAIVGTVAVIVLPDVPLRADGTPGRIFVYKGSETWAGSSNWILVGSDECTDYPNLEGDIAMFCLTKTGKVRPMVPPDVTLSGLYVGRVDNENPSVIFKGSGDPGHLTMSRSDGSPAVIQLCPKNASGFQYVDWDGFTVGDNSWTAQLIIGTNTTCIFDFGCVDETASLNFMQRTNGTGIPFDIQEGATLVVRNVSSSKGWDVPNLGGSGTIWLQGASTLQAGKDYSAFSGQIRSSTDLCSLQNASVTNVAGELCGYVVGSDLGSIHVPDGYSDKNQLGQFYVPGGLAPHESLLPKRSIKSYGGAISPLRTNNASAWPDNAQTAETDLLDLDRGLTLVYLGRPGIACVPTNVFRANGLAQRNKATLVLADVYSRAKNDESKKSALYLPAATNLAIGVAGDGRTSSQYPVVPWIVMSSTTGDEFSTEFDFAAFDENGRLYYPSGICQIQNYLSSFAQSLVDTPNQNVVGRYLGLEFPKSIDTIIVNSLRLRYNQTKPHQFGANKKLVITSGGLILGAFDNNPATTTVAIGTADGGVANGTLEFVNTAYVFTEKMPNANFSMPEIWTPIVSTNGFVLGKTGSLRLGGDQTGIDDEIVVNDGSLHLGDATHACQLDVPVRLVGGGSKIVVETAGSLGNASVYFDAVGGFSPKVEIAAGVEESCQKLFFRDAENSGEWSSMPTGLYGATGSGANIIDDEHFAGTGTLRVLDTDDPAPGLSAPALQHAREETADFTASVTIGGGAVSCDYYVLLATPGEDSVLTNFLCTATDSTNLAFTVSALEPSSDYTIRLFATNSEGVEATSAVTAFSTLDIAYDVRVGLVSTDIVPAPCSATVPWTLEAIGYHRTVASVTAEFGLADGELDRSCVFDSPAELGSYEGLLAGLLPETDYNIRITVVSTNAETHASTNGSSVVCSFRTTAETYGAGRVALENYSYTITDIAANLLASNLTANAAVYACFGDTYGAQDLDAWARADYVGTVAPGEEVRFTALSANLLEIQPYARWAIVPLDGETELRGQALWTPMLYLPTADTDLNPTPAITLAARMASPTAGEISTTVDTVGYGATGVTLSYSIGTNLDEMSASTVFATDVRLGVTVVKPLMDLAPGAYFCIVTADNGLENGSCSATNTFAIALPSAGTGGTVKRIGDYVIHTFTADGTLELPTDVEADLLVVGGGGAGGYKNGGGGGAGGLIYRRGVTLSGGTYEITVGAGGQSVSGNADAGNGEDTVFAFGEEEIARAVGGGGGGTRDAANFFGASGGSGGGNTGTRGCPAGRVAGQGNIGAPGLMTDWEQAGGGGGAGEPGHVPQKDLSRAFSRYVCGAGGDGLEIDISGSFTYYAAGGGGGGYCRQWDENTKRVLRGFGGAGGGGDGAGSDGFVSQQVVFFPATPGVDGFGGGGGGGGTDSDNNFTPGVTSGAAGGSGTVIVRYWAPAEGTVSASPVIELRGATDNGDGTVTLAWHLVSAGAGASSCSVAVAFGTEATTLSRTIQLSDDSPVDGEETVAGFVPGHTYYFALRATNDKGVTASAASKAKVKLAPSSDYATTKFGGEPGLLQAKFVGLPIDYDSSVLASDTVRRELGTLMSLVRGVKASNVSGLDGVASTWDDVTTFAYRGYIRLEAGTFYRFATGIDDYARLSIDGEILVDQPQSAGMMTGIYECRRSGWHAIEVRIGNNSSTAGYADNDVGKRGGIIYQTVVPGTKSDNWTFQQLVTTTSDPFLRTGPDGRGFSVGKRSDAQGQYTASIELGASPSASVADRLFLFYSDRQCGENTDDWTGNVAYEGVLPATATTLSFAAELPDSAQVLRYAIVDGNGAASWSETFYRGAIFGPIISQVLGDGTKGDTLLASVSANNAAGAIAEIHFGTSSAGKDALDRTAAITLDNLGEGVVKVPNLDPGATYYWYVRVVDDNGVSDETDVFQTTMASGAKIGAFWIDGTQYPKLLMHVTISDVGAGGMASLAFRYRGNEYYQWDNWNTYSVAETHTVTTTGDQVFEVDAEALGLTYGDIFDAQVTVANNLGSTIWSVTATSGAVQIVDAREFVWCGPASGGAWTDAANWSTAEEGPKNAPGYPIWGSSAVIPSSVREIVLDGDIWVFSLAFPSASASEPFVFAFRAGGAGGALHVSQPFQGNGILFGNGSFTFGEWNEFTIDGAAFSIERNAGGLSFSEGSMLTLCGGADVSVNSTFTMNTASNRLYVTEQSHLALGYWVDYSARWGEFVIDDSYVSSLCNNDQRFSAKTHATDPGRFVFKGRNPRLETSQLDRDDNKNAGTIYFDFEVPVGGYLQAPIIGRGQRDKLCMNNAATVFSFSVLPTSPALLEDNATITTTLVDWWNGFNAVMQLDGSSAGTLAETDLYGNGTLSGLELTLTGTAAAPASAPANAVDPVVTTYGAYTIYTFTNAAMPGAITFANPVEADILVVGGGGAGGWSSTIAIDVNNTGGGGGGGGGDVVYESGVSIPAGTYRVDVGAGGWNHPNCHFLQSWGDDGNASSFFGFTAGGGGGGGGMNNGGGQTSQPARGGNGANGGGASQWSAYNGKALPGGYDSGTREANYASGGGGDGGQGSNDVGGIGRNCDITGFVHCYGSGGGAGASKANLNGGLGGTESGGRGAMLAYPSTFCPPAEPGVDGLGGGGGGGGSDYVTYRRMSGYGQRSGAKGGDGCVIIRVKTLADTDPNPLFELRGNESVSANTFAIDADYISAGYGSAAPNTTFTLTYGLTGEATATAELLPAPQSCNPCRFTFTGLVLRPGETYEATITAENELGYATTRGPFTFTVPATVLIDETAGLWQAKFSGESFDEASDVVASDTLRRELGAVMLYNFGGYVSPIDGFVNRFEYKTTYVYKGYMFMEKDKPVYFARAISGLSYKLTIDGSVKWNTRDSNGASFAVTPSFTGWHSFELRIFRGEGSNPSTRFQFALGMGWTDDPDVYAAFNAAAWDQKDSTGWKPLLDPGDGSLFRTDPVPMRELSIVSAIRTTAGTRANVALQATPGATSMNVYALLDTVNHDDGDAYTMWHTYTLIGSITADGTALLAKNIDLGDNRFLRFVGVMNDVSGGYSNYAWTQVIDISEITETEGAAPVVQFNSVTPANASATVEATIVSAGSGAANCTLYVAYGLEPDVLRNTNVLAASATAGVYGRPINALLPDRVYYGVVYAVNASGTSAVSPAEPFSFQTPALVETNGGRSDEGLWQGVLAGDFNEVSSVRDLEEGEGMGQRRVEAGPIASWGLYEPGDSIPSALHPDAPLTMQAGKTYAYDGFIWLENDKTYYIGWDVDDAARVSIGGVDQGTVTKRKAKAGFLYTKAFTVTNATSGGWYPIDLRLGNAEGAGGGLTERGYTTVHVAHRGEPLGFGILAADGPQTSQGLSASSAKWQRLDGTSYGARLVTERPTRSIDYAAYSLDSGTLSVDFTLSQYSAPTPLYVCYGAAHGGDDPAGWTTCEQVNTIGMLATEYNGYQLAVGSSVRFVRFYVDCGAAGLVWTHTIPLVEPDAPILSSSFAADDRGEGDTIYVTGVVDWAGEGNAVCDVTAEVSRTGDFSDAVVWPVATGLRGGDTFETPLFTADRESAAYIVPGSTVTVRLRAVNATGKADLTPIREVTTLEGAGFKGDPIGKASFRTGTFTVNVDPIGATGGALDGTVVTLLVGGVSGDLVPVATNVALIAGPQTFYYDFPAADPIGTSYRWAIAYTNECRTQAWGGETDIHTIATIDDSIYWWKGEVAEGAWNDSENWDCSNYDALGFPQTADSTASFEHCVAGTEYSISMEVSSSAKLCLTNEAVSISFLGTGNPRFAPSEIVGDALAGTNLFEGVAFEAPEDRSLTVAPTGSVTVVSGGFRANGDLTIGVGATLELDSASAYSAGRITLDECASVVLANETVWTRPNNSNSDSYLGSQAEGSVFAVTSGSSFTVGRWAFVEGSTLVVDDATVSGGLTGSQGSQFVVNNSNVLGNPGTIELRGNAPAFNHLYLAHTSDKIGTDTEWNLYVGQATTTTTALVTAYDFGTVTKGSSKFVLNAYRDIEVYRHGFIHEIIVVESTLDGEIDPSNVVFGEVPTGASYFYYTYDHTDATEGATVTGIRLHLDSGATTMIFTH